jgi:hypothetical protein
MLVDMPKGRLSVNGSDEPSLAIFFPSIPTWPSTHTCWILCQFH